MATLELAIDATKAQQGAQVAEQAFVKVKTAAEGAARSVQITSQAVSSAFQATGGTVQVAGGITATAKALSELNVAAASSNAARLLLEIGKTAQDFREVAAGIPKVTRPIIETTAVFDSLGVKVGETSRVIGSAAVQTSRLGTVFATLNGIIQANPLLAAATAISAIGTAITLFSSETDKATESFERFGDALRDFKIDAQTAAYLGIAGPGSQSQAKLQRIFEASRTAQEGGGINLRAFTGTELDRRVAEFAIQQRPKDYETGKIREFLDTGGTRRFGGARGEREIFTEGLPDIQLTQQETQELLRELYRETAKQLEAEKTSTAAAQATARIRQQFLQDLQNNPPIGVGDEVLARPYTPRPEQRLPTAEEVQQGVRGYLSQPDYSIRALQLRFGEGLGSAADALQNFVRKANTTVAGLADPSGLRAAAVTYIDPVADRTRMVSQLPGAERRRAFFEEQRQQRAAEDEAEKAKVAASQRVAENFARAADYAGQVGGSLGSAFADVLMKTTTLRQAFASIVASFARQGLSDIGTAIFRGVVNGLTPTQAGANAGINTQATQ